MHLFQEQGVRDYDATARQSPTGADARGQSIPCPRCDRNNTDRYENSPAGGCLTGLSIDSGSADKVAYGIRPWELAGKASNPRSAVERAILIKIGFTNEQVAAHRRPPSSTPPLAGTP